MSIDIASLGIKVDSSSAVSADDALNKLANTGAKTEASTEKVTKASAALNAELAALVRAANANTNALAAEAEQDKATSVAIQYLASSVEKLSGLLGYVTNLLGINTEALDNSALAQERAAIGANSLSEAEAKAGQNTVALATANDALAMASDKAANSNHSLATSTAMSANETFNLAEAQKRALVEILGYTSAEADAILQTRALAVAQTGAINSAKELGDALATVGKGSNVGNDFTSLGVSASKAEAEVDSLVVAQNKETEASIRNKQAVIEATDAANRLAYEKKVELAATRQAAIEAENAAKINNDLALNTANLANVEIGAVDATTRLGNAHKQASNDIENASNAKREAANADSLLANSELEAANAARANAIAQENLEKRVDKLLGSVFPFAAAQGKVNAEIEEATYLYRIGSLNAEEYAGVFITLNQRATVFANKQSELSKGLIETANNAKFTRSNLTGLATDLVQLGNGDFSLINLIQIFSDLASFIDTGSSKAEEAVGTFDSMKDTLKELASNLALGAVNSEGLAVANSSTAVSANAAATSETALAVATGGAATAATGAVVAGAEQSASNAAVALSADAAAVSEGALAVADDAAAVGAQAAAVASAEQAAANLAVERTAIGAAAAQGALGIASGGTAVGAQAATVASAELAVANGLVEKSAISAALAQAIAFAPITIILAAIAAAIIAIAGTFAIATNEMSKSVGDVTKGMNLTEKQLDVLKEKGVSTTITVGDSFKGLWKTIEGRLQAAFGPQIEWLQKAFSDAYDFVANATKNTIKFIVGTMFAGVALIKFAWNELPGALSDIATSAANGVIDIFDKMVNAVITKINTISGAINMASNAMGMGDIFEQIEYRQSAHIENPNAGKSDSFGARGAASASAAFNEGVAATSRFASDWRGNSRDAARERITGELDKDKDKSGGKKGGASSSNEKSEAEKAYDDAIKSGQDYLKSLQDETAAIGKNKMELKALEVEQAAIAATKAGVTKESTALAAAIRAEGEAWKQGIIGEETRKLRQELSDLNEQTDFENSLIGKSAEAQAVANAQREIALKLRALEREGIHLSASEIEAETKAYVANAAAKGAKIDETNAAREFADHVGRMNDNLQSATSAFGELFGTAGKGFSDLISTLGDYYTFQIEQEQKLDEIRREKGENSIEYTNAVTASQEEMAAREMAMYGNLLSGVKHLFKEKSTAYKVMESIEKAYAAVRLAMAIKEILTENVLTATKVGGAAARMATDTAETTSSVAKSGLRATADGIAAFAKTLASLPFPFNLLAGAAVLAALVGVGVAIAGGGGSSTPTASSELEKAELKPIDYTQQDSPYSVLQTKADYNVNQPSSGFTGQDGSNNGSTSIGYSNDNSNSSMINSGNSFNFKTEINAPGADDGVVDRIQGLLDVQEARVIQKAREAVRNDNLNSYGRQTIGGVN